MKKIRTATLTTHFVLNYGAFLQAFALQNFLINNDIENEIIDYRSEKLPSGRRYFVKNNSYKAIIKNILLFFNYTKYRKYKERIVKFDTCIEKYLKLIEYDIDHINSSNFDCIICGSDQIWNLDLIKDSTYFLNFITNKNTRKISYAASHAMDNINISRRRMIYNFLSSFSAISIRESSGAKLYEEILKKKVSNVFDPVFLIDKQYWIDLSKNSNINNLINDDYIFVYLLGTSKLDRIFIEKIRSIYSLKIVNCLGSYNDKFNSDFCFDSLSPIDFLSLVINSKFICTNSFHATCFAVIFNKMLAVRLNSMQRNSRMVDLLNDINFSDCIFDNKFNLDDVNNEIFDLQKSSYEAINIKVSENIRRSKQFLLENI